MTAFLPSPPPLRAWVLLGLSLGFALGLPHLPAADPSNSYAVADDGNSLVRMNRFDGSGFEVIGGTNVSDIEAIVSNLDNSLVYAADDGQFGVLSLATGAFSSIGSGVGSGTGTRGSVSFDDIDGLTIHPWSGVIYGSVRTSDGSPDDLLIQIDPVSGQYVPNAFGTGVDYVVIATSDLSLSTTLYDIDDLAINPVDGQMYGVANSSGGNDRLVRIDPATGDVTDVGRLREAGGSNVNDVEGFAFFNDGAFYGTTGQAGISATNNRLWQIDPTTGEMTDIGAFGSGEDFEALASLTGGANRILGTVFRDLDLNGVFEAGDQAHSGATVQLYLDADGSGDVDPGDTLMNEVISAVDGTYEFVFAIDGDFVVQVDQGSLPPGVASITTPDHYGITFSGYEQTSSGNDFGFEFAWLSITKNVSPSGPVSPGQPLEYTIEVTNVSGLPLTQVSVNDTMDSALLLTPASANVTAPSTLEFTVADTFSSQSYNANTGSLSWVGDWVESDPDGVDGPGDGFDIDQSDYVGIFDGRLQFHWAYVDAEAIYRSADLTDASFATFTFDWETDGLNGDKELQVQVATSPAGPWTDLTTLSGTATGSESFDITAYIGATTTVRFMGAGEDWEEGDYTYLDNVEIRFDQPGGSQTGPAGAYPLFASGFDLLAGESLQIVYQATVGVNPGTGPLVNAAVATANEALEPAFASVSSPVGIHSISGQVRDDVNGDGLLVDPSDRPLPGVVVRLYIDLDGNGLVDGADTLIGETTTDSFGNYLFEGLADGTFLVEEINPEPSISTNDVDGNGTPDRIAVAIAGSSVTDQDFVDAVDPRGYIYDAVTGQILPGGSVAVSGPGAVVITQDGSTGQYAFELDANAPVAGSYTLALTPPPGYRIASDRPVAGPSFDPTGGFNPTVLGSFEDSGSVGYLSDGSSGANPYYLTFDLAPGDPLVINNNLPVVRDKPVEFLYWSASVPGAGGGAGANTDGDQTVNLLEYALCGDPSTGLETAPLVCLSWDEASNRVQLSFRRPVGVVDVTYTVEVLTDLRLTPVGWVGTDQTPVVVDQGDGSETVTWEDLEADALLSGLGRGFVRLTIEHPGSGERHSSPVWGFQRRQFATGCETFSNPFLDCALFAGTVDSTGSSVVQLANSVGDGDLDSVLEPTESYYLEVTSGSRGGHRFEVAVLATLLDGSQTQLVLDLTHARSTSSSLGGLDGSTVVLRRHHSLGGLLDLDQLTATADPATADRALFFDREGQAFETYFLFDNAGSPHWAKVGDSGLADAGARVLAPDEGCFVHARSLPSNQVFLGEVRANDFVNRLHLGANMVGGGWPMDQSPSARRYAMSDGFTGNADQTQADRLQFWRGDRIAGALSYETCFLVSAGPYQSWVRSGDATLTSVDDEELFPAFRAVMIQSVLANPPVPQFLPWTPGSGPGPGGGSILLIPSID